MALQYENLDDATRTYMLSEFRSDVDSGKLYLSPRLNREGRTRWSDLLNQAIESHDDNWLERRIVERSLLNAFEEKKRRDGGITRAKIPTNAASLLAEGEFNRFYVRGICLRSIQNGIGEVQVCRGRESRQPRLESERLIGALLSAQAVLEDLRSHIATDTAFGVPAGAGSGLTVRLPIKAPARIA